MNHKAYARRKEEIAAHEHVELDVDAVAAEVRSAPYRKHHRRAIIRALINADQSEAHRILWNAATHTGQPYPDLVMRCQAVEEFDFEPVAQRLEPLSEEDPWADFEGIRLFENDEDTSAADLADEMAEEEEEWETLVIAAC